MHKMTTVQICETVPQKDTKPLQKLGMVRYIAIDAQAHALPAIENKTVHVQAPVASILLPFNENMARKIPSSCIVELWIRSQKSMSLRAPILPSEWDQASIEGMKARVVKIEATPTRVEF